MSRQYKSVNEMVIGELGAQEVQKECWNCRGKGRAHYPVYHNDTEVRTCHTCKGTGAVFSHYEVGEESP